MLMWLVILGGALVLTLAGIGYLVARVARFRPVARAGKWRYALSAAITAAAAGAVGFGMGTVNLFVAAIHLALFWLLCDGLVWVLSRVSNRIRQMRCYLAGILALVLTVSYLGYGYYTDRHVVVTEYTVTTEKTAKPMTIAMLSDAHLGTTFDGSGFAGHMDTLQALQPDMVVIAGDLIDGSSRYEDILIAAKALGKLQTPYGIYFAFGNHDKNYYGEDRSFSEAELKQLLAENGIIVLEDAVVQLPNGFDVIGRQDCQESGRYPISELMARTRDGAFVIDINHQPTDYAAEAAAGPDLVLSGHTHGGQLLLVRRAVGRLGGNNRVYGMEKRENTTFLVSSGISDWAMDFKTGCVSEIVLIHIEPAEK